MTFILLATYNGACWLEPLWASIQGQSQPDWRLLARDDGSQDGTPELLREFARRDCRVEVLDAADSGRERLGPAGNFAALMAAAMRRGAANVFFADQDDVWRMDKLALQTAALKSLEQRNGFETPVLVHSDLEIVDEQLNTLAASFFAQERRNPAESTKLARLVVQNSVTGCATAINRALLEVALPVPAGSPMHDWWLALCAAATGKIQFLPQPLVKYRQHANNQVGARRRLATLLPFGSAARQRREKAVRHFAGAIAQAKELRDRLQQRNSSTQVAALNRLAALCRLFDAPFPVRRRFGEMRRLGAMRPGLFGKLQVWYCLRGLARLNRTATEVGGKNGRLDHISIADARPEIANHKSQIATNDPLRARCG